MSDKILILSRQDDGSTSTVIEWLVKMEKDFIRINTDDERTLLEFIDIDRNQLIVNQNDQRINLLDCRSVWHRRSGFSLKNVIINHDQLEEKILFDKPNYHKDHIRSEYNILNEYMHHMVQNDRPAIGNYYSTDVNKLTVLALAKEKGLAIPRGYIVTTKNDIRAILENTPSNFIVTKAISQGVYSFSDNYGYYSYTERITEESLKELPDRFFPSLIQEEIKKKYELRVFYLNKTFYPMAIFSQKNEGTVVDFRKYTDGKPQRKVPYTLPKEEEQKLIALMDELELNTGSIDIIVDTDNNYVFLEVNPVGQFGMTSVPCNYYLERTIAETL